MLEVADRTFRLGSKFHNWYLIEDGGRFTVIDAGCSKEWRVLDAALSSMGGSTSDIEAVLVTHAHPDHFGFGKEAQDNGISVKVHEADIDRATGEYEGPALGPLDVPLWRPRAFLFLLALVRKGVMTLPHVASIETFDDGETLNVPGRPQVIHTPGHTDGHAAFHAADGATLFTGDALATMHLFGGPDGPQRMPDVFHIDAQQAADSLDRLAGLGDVTILPGHGDAWKGDAADAVAAARRR